MGDRITREDADLIARRLVARITQLLLGIALTLGALWIISLLFLGVVSFSGPNDPAGPSILGILTLVAVVLLAYVVVMYWRRLLRGWDR